MGNALSGYIRRGKDSGAADDATAANLNIPGSSALKRRLNNSNDESPSSKVAKLDTSKYLLKNLFVDGKYSDVCVTALGYEWRLHRLYLEQCEYFRCLFSGNWSDSKSPRYQLTIVDERITIEGLDKIFASLYSNEIEFEPKNVPGILAAASMVGLQACINKCEDEIIRTVNVENVMEYLDLCTRYGCVKGRHHCTSYLIRYFWKLSQKMSLLRKLSYEQMVMIFSQPELCVAEGEKDLYMAAKRWIYIRLEDKEPANDLELHKFFKEQPRHCFYRYKALLQHIRFQHMVTSKLTLNTLQEEHIIGREIISDIIQSLWDQLMINEESPQTNDTISDEYFYSHCRRLGRHLSEPDKCWRWAGFDFGLDLLIRCNGGIVSMTRNLMRDNINHCLSMRRSFKIHYRMIVLNNNAEIVMDSGRKMASLFADKKEFIGQYPMDLRDFSVHFFYVHQAAPGTESKRFWRNVKDVPGHNFPVSSQSHNSETIIS